jgi:transcriptional regulator with XRE-family HTH domain
LAVSEAQILRFLAARIKTLRRSKDWSQEDLAEHASMQRSYIADLERGFRNPSVRTLLKIANALGVLVPTLLEDEGKVKRGGSNRGSH